MCSLRWGSGDRDSCKVSFDLASLMALVIMLPCVSALVSGSFTTFGSFGSIAGVPGAMLADDLDLIHCHLGYACEAMCHTHVQHSQLYSDAQNSCLCSSHLSQPCCLCVLGKQVALPHQKAPTLPEECAERPSKIISADLLTVEVPSISGAHYVLAVTDVSTSYHWTTPLRLKSDAMDKLCHIILSMPETHHPLTLCTDGSGEFFNARLDLWLNKQGILHPSAPPYTSE